MSISIRQKFGLTQQQLAAWLGIPRSSIALAERGRQALPFTANWQRDLRLTLAGQGLALNPAGGPPLPPEPPQPLPAPNLAPVLTRLRYCRFHALRMSHELEKMRDRAAPFEARFSALPTLRAWTGPDSHPEQAASWLDRFEEEAVSELNSTCGATPQALLAIRQAALLYEAGLLEQHLASQSAA